MNDLKRYVDNIVQDMDCDEKEKKEVAEELEDHLNLIKEEYVKKGFDEPEAIQEAIKRFGNEEEIRKGLASALFPYQKIFKVGVWILFSIYSFWLMMILLIGRIINYVRSGFDYWYFREYNGGFFNIDTWTQNANLIPFRNIWLYIVDDKLFSVDFLTGYTLTAFIAFIPLGIFFPLLFKKMNMLKPFLIKLTIISFIIEVLQFTLHVGVFDIDEVIVYTLGGVLGFVAFQILKELRSVIKNIYNQIKI